MSYKRTRKEFEADLQAQQSPFVVYGTPLPPLDPEVRDDGSFVPVWKQEVRDERGRKRLHGAFTGGFSAGYFNTVGSKEGWTPSTFVSSRSNKHKDAQQSDQDRREMYMDEEDLADAAESQLLETNQSFAGIGSTGDDVKRKAGLMDVFRPQGETVGLKLLRKMGWKDGQGIGPRVRRKADLDDHQTNDTHLFAPVDSNIISFNKKYDRKGLGFTGESKLQSKQHDSDSGEEDSFTRSRPNRPKPILQPRRVAAFGTGVLNEDDEDEDPYSMGPAISLSRIAGGEKKAKKKTPITKTAAVAAPASAAAPVLKIKPTFRPKGISMNKSAPRRCHDGRLPLAGFILVQSIDTDNDKLDHKYPVPTIPPGWTSSKSKEDTPSTAYRSTTDAAKASDLNPAARSAILGESTLPGKSVFDFLSPEARNLIVSATGRSDLPAALGETVPQPSTKSNTIDLAEIPVVHKATALSALGRAIGGWFPYSEDEAKRTRYREFLEHNAGTRPDFSLPPTKTPKEAAAQLAELREFAHAAEVFKPMTGFMANRFTSASHPGGTLDAGAQREMLTTATDRRQPEDPAEAAARMGMFGPMTRTVGRFAPTRLVCKRFGIRPPDNAVGDQHEGETVITDWHGGPATATTKRTEDLASGFSINRDVQTDTRSKTAGDFGGIMPQPAKVDAERNEALEQQKAGDELFKSIFGDDDDDDDDE